MLWSTCLDRILSKNANVMKSYTSSCVKDLNLHIFSLLFYNSPRKCNKCESPVQRNVENILDIQLLPSAKNKL